MKEYPIYRCSGYINQSLFFPSKLLKAQLIYQTIHHHYVFWMGYLSIQNKAAAEI